MRYQEHAHSFTCCGEQLIGIVSVPAQPSRRGVLIVVGGPQYRAGSHRQFTQLARSLAAQGVAVLRFDYRGMGDSDGEARNFNAVDADLRAAVNQLLAAVPDVEEVVIWGLCDGASAALFYAHQDARVSGLVLLNPWARTNQSIARATLKHYYLERLLNPAMWQKIRRGQFDYRAAGAGLLRLMGKAFARNGSEGHDGNGNSGADAAALPQRMQHGLHRFGGQVLLIISGADLTGQEFLDMTKVSRKWRTLLASSRVAQRHLAGADHTFSRRAWSEQVTRWTNDWLRSW